MPGNVPDMETRELTLDVWSGLVGDSLLLQFDDGSSVDLRVTAAEPAPGDPARNAGAYSVLFAGPEDPYLPQQIWPLSHPDIGEHQIFLVPIGQDDSGYQYEAVFSRPPSDPS